MEASCAYGDRPRLRGVSHQLAFYLGLVGSAALLAVAPAGQPRLAAAVYAASFLTLFGVSATFHRRRWTRRGHRRMRRLDHSAIYLKIAGTCTPVALLGLDPAVGASLLMAVWIGAGLGVLQAVFWPDVPRALRAAFYLGLGWYALGDWPAIHQSLGAGRMTLLAAGGALYSLGAVVYATRRPDPFPDVFGFHEVFHLLVVAAAGCHAALVVSLLLG